MTNPKEPDKSDEFFPDWLDEEDPFGLKEEMEIILFQCLDCHGTDEVPEYIIGEFSVDKNNRDEVELHCPHCNGTMIEAKNAPSD